MEEIENGLHPVAVRRMVEYLIDVAMRLSIQSAFTTHSEDALAVLPPEAIWSSIDGKTRQGRISIEALRAITGRIDETMAIFVEDAFAKEWVEGITRSLVPEHMDEIGVYGVAGESQAHAIHTAHTNNPALRGKLKSICILDGNAPKAEQQDQGVLKLPGEDPEAEVFNYVLRNIDTLSMKLAVALHLPTSKDSDVRKVVLDVSRSNRDPHLLFSQVGDKAGLIPANIVSSAFISLWMEGNQSEAQRVAEFIKRNVETAQ